MTAGVPPRVEAGTKAALLDLVDGAVEAGWTTARACAVLELDGRRCRRWQHRRGAGRLDDNTAGGTAVHAITPTERRAILELFERWGDIDGGYRKLAHRGSYENLVWVSPSTLYRVLAMSNTTAADPAVSPRRSHTAPRTDATAAKSDRTASGPKPRNVRYSVESDATCTPEQHRLGPQMLDVAARLPAAREHQQRMNQHLAPIMNRRPLTAGRHTTADNASPSPKPSAKRPRTNKPPCAAT